MLIGIFITLQLMLMCLAACTVALFNIRDRLSQPFNGKVTGTVKMDDESGDWWKQEK